MEEGGAHVAGPSPAGAAGVEPGRSSHQPDGVEPTLPPRHAWFQVHNEAEVQRILAIANSMRVPVTFRAAGTSLAGQAITDSILLKVNHSGNNFRNYTVHVSAGCPAGGGGAGSASVRLGARAVGAACACCWRPRQGLACGAGIRDEDRCPGCPTCPPFLSLLAP